VTKLTLDLNPQAHNPNFHRDTFRKLKDILGILTFFLIFPYIKKLKNRSMSQNLLLPWQSLTLLLFGLEIFIILDQKLGDFLKR
jgi:hypothetical protein